MKVILVRRANVGPIASFEEGKAASGAEVFSQTMGTLMKQFTGSFLVPYSRAGGAAEAGEAPFVSYRMQVCLLP